MQKRPLSSLLWLKVKGDLAQTTGVGRISSQFFNNTDDFFMELYATCYLVRVYNKVKSRWVQTTVLGAFDMEY